MTTDLAVIAAALKAALSADEVLAGFSLDYTLSEWGKARAASDDFDAASREYVAELVERVKAAEAEVEHQKRIREGEGYRAQMAWEDQHRSRLGAERAWARWRERAEAAEATIARVRELAEQHPGTAWNSGLNLRQALRDALGGTPTDAPGGADSADDEQNRFSGEDTAGATEPILRTDGEAKA